MKGNIVQNMNIRVDIGDRSKIVNLKYNVTHGAKLGLQATQVKFNLKENEF
jgi:hypothetical protein